LTRRTPTPTPQTPAGGVTRYRDRIFDAKRHDPYQAAGKYAEPTRCGTCGAAFHHGRWQWASAPQAGHIALCPACQRIRDKLPAGEITLEGAFVHAHRAELVQLVRNEAEHEGKEHPLHRIMQLDEDADRVWVSTTDIHLPQRIGEALKRAYDGELQVHYGHDEYSVRVHWRR
jgi:hypothetical protein